MLAGPYRNGNNPIPILRKHRLIGCLRVAHIKVEAFQPLAQAKSWQPHTLTDSGPPKSRSTSGNSVRTLTTIHSTGVLLLLLFLLLLLLSCYYDADGDDYYYDAAYGCSDSGFPLALAELPTGTLRTAAQL